MSATSPRPPSEKRSRRGSKHAPRTVDELTAQNVAAIHRLEAAAQAHQGRIDLIADHVARFAGSALFLVLHVVWFAAWIVRQRDPRRAATSIRSRSRS